MKLHKRLASILSIGIFVTNINPVMGQVSDIDNIISTTGTYTNTTTGSAIQVTTGSAVNIGTVGPMNLPAIDPVKNPAEQNWLSEEIATQTLGDANRYRELTQADFDRVTTIKIWSKDLEFIPTQIGNLSNLRTLDVRLNKLGSLPESIGNLSELEELNVRNNKLSSLPESIINLSNLKNLDISSNGLTSLPESIGNLSELEELNVGNNKLSSLPESIINLSNLKNLNISRNGFTSLPESIINLSNLKNLDISSNGFTSLPESIINLSNLKNLDISSNRFTSLPESIGNLSELEELNVGYNELSSLPDSIGDLEFLMFLEAGHNKLSSLPDSIGNLELLVLLILADNKLSSLPEGLYDKAVEIYMPNQKIELDKKKVGKNGVLTIINPIELAGKPVPLNTSAGIDYDPVNNTITFKNIKNGNSFEFAYNGWAGNASVNINGRVEQPFEVNQAPIIGMHKSEFTVGEEIKPLDWITIKDDGDIAKVKFMKLNSNIPFESKDGKEYFKEEGKFDITYEAIDEEGDSTRETFEIIVKSSPSKPNPDPVPNPDPTPDGSGGSSLPEVEGDKQGFGTMTHAKYIEGYPGNEFKGEKSITRGEFVTMIVRLLLDGTEVPVGDTKFKDIRPTYFGRNEIAFLDGLGVLKGYEDGTFKADAPITRAEVAAILSRINNLNASNQAVKAYEDLKEVHWAYNAIQSVTEAGYMVGYKDNSFKPNEAITRAETVATLNRIYRVPCEKDDLQIYTVPFTDVESNYWAYIDILKASITHEHEIDEDEHTNAK